MQENPDQLYSERLNNDIGSQAAIKAFEEDLLQVRLHKISRFPRLILKREWVSNSVMVVGYRPYKDLYY